MRIVLAAMVAVLYLCLLWGPALWLARRRWRRGDYRVLGRLRVLLPAQLVATVVLAVAADAAGLHNPAGIIAALSVAASLLGAASLLIGRLPGHGGAGG
ncbi:hypothetical protein ACLB1G_02460 [Oxalobacteraceae bacterium A2-2]